MLSLSLTITKETSPQGRGKPSLPPTPSKLLYRYNLFKSILSCMIIGASDSRFSIRITSKINISNSLYLDIHFHTHDKQIHGSSCLKHFIFLYVWLGDITVPSFWPVISPSSLPDPKKTKICIKIIFR